MSATDAEKAVKALAQRMHDDTKYATFSTDLDVTVAFERVLREKGLVELIEAGRESREAIGGYSIALMRRADGDSTDDSEIHAAIERCVKSTKMWDAALSKLAALQKAGAK